MVLESPQSESRFKSYGQNSKTGKIMTECDSHPVLSFSGNIKYPVRPAPPSATRTREESRLFRKQMDYSCQLGYDSHPWMRPALDQISGQISELSPLIFHFVFWDWDLYFPYQERGLRFGVHILRRLGKIWHRCAFERNWRLRTVGSRGWDGNDNYGPVHLTRNEMNEQG